MRSRLELAKLFADKGYTLGAEIGVLDGYYSEVLLKTIPKLRLYAIDPWKEYDGFKTKRIQPFLDKAYEGALQKLSAYNCEVIRKTSMEAVSLFKDGCLDFVYIDANHDYPYIKEDIEAWTPKVRKGGIVAGDDYYISRNNIGVIKAVDEYVAENGYTLNLTDWNDDLIRDNRQPSWYFIKEEQ